MTKKKVFITMATEHLAFANVIKKNIIGFFTSITILFLHRHFNIPRTILHSPSILRQLLHPNTLLKKDIWNQYAIVVFDTDAILFVTICLTILLHRSICGLVKVMTKTASVTEMHFWFQLS